MGKPKVGFFDFTSCEGCQIELTNFGSPVFLELLNHIEIVEFREAMTETAYHLDIACIEGSFTLEKQRKRLNSIRNRSDIVIAYGACAVNGGINALKNHQKDFKSYVYGKDADMPHLETNPKALAISEVIKVDYNIYGCPIDRLEFLKILTELLHGKLPTIPNYPVCIECKRNETVCRYEYGDHCLGIVARAGCRAVCPAYNIPCDACRGFIDEPNLEALEKALIERSGFSERRAREKILMFTANCVK